MTQQSLPDNTGAPLVGFTASWNTGSFSEHSHARHQLLYCVRGVVHMITPQHTWVVPQGRALWIPANFVHSYRIDRATVLDIIYLRKGAFNIEHEDTCFVLKVSPLLRELIEACVRLPQEYAPDSPEMRLAHVLVDQLRGVQSLPFDLPFPVDVRARAIAEHLENNPGGGEPLAKLARQAGASARTIERVFYRETGMTFTTWRRRQRLLAALDMLALGNNATTVAFSVGYSSVSSFIVAFKDMFGITPNRYFA